MKVIWKQLNGYILAEADFFSFYFSEAEML